LHAATVSRRDRAPDVDDDFSCSDLSNGRDSFSDDEMQDDAPAHSLFEFDELKRDGFVRRRGAIEWRTDLKGYLGGNRPPHLVFDDERVYVTHDDGVTALSAKTGHVLWHSRGPGNCLCLSGDLLLAAGGRDAWTEAFGRYVMARSVATGREMFR